MSTNTTGVRALILTSASALALAGLADAQAATKDAHLSVTVSVVAKCTISTAAILWNEAASVMCTSDARGAVSGDTNGTRPAYAVKRVRGALTTYGPVSTSRSDSTRGHRETQVVTITF
jgi:hypothetical protein